MLETFTMGELIDQFTEIFLHQELVVGFVKLDCYTGRVRLTGVFRDQSTWNKL